MKKVSYASESVDSILPMAHKRSLTHNVLFSKIANNSYGEDRYRLIGIIENRLFVVVYTKRHEVIRIISARKANLREVKHYENSINED